MNTEPHLRLRAYTVAAIALAWVTVSAAREQPSVGGISGVVRAEATNRPMGGAVVTARGANVSRTTVTDPAGVFHFSQLPPGGFALTVSKPAYLQTAVAMIGTVETQIIPVSPATFTEVTVLLKKGGVITGTVSDLDGLPAGGVDVSVEGATGRFRTDAQGNYRAYGLTPGSYLVAATPRASLAASAQVRAMRDDEIDRILAQLARQRSVAASESSRAQPEPLDIARRTYSKVFHPSTTDPAAARLVRVEADQEVSGVDITLRLASSAQLRGTLLTRAGQPVPGASIRAVRSDSPSPVTIGAVTGPDGGFVVRNVFKGATYHLVAKTRTALPEWAEQTTTVSDDETEIVLRMQPCYRISGEITFRDRDDKRLAVHSTRVGIVNGETTQAGDPFLPRPVLVDDPAGRFEIYGAIPGTYELRAETVNGSLWRIEAALLDGRDVLDTGIKLDGDLRGLQLIFGETTVLSGTVRGQRLSDRDAVLVFPAEPAVRQQTSRRIQLVATNAVGEFSVEGLPPGDYIVAVLIGGRNTPRSAFASEAVLAKLGPNGVRFSLRRGERTVQNIGK